MTIDDVQLLYEYDRWANDRVIKAVSELTVEQFTRDLNGSFRSVRDTLVHIISGERGWLVFWKAPSHGPSFLNELRKQRDALFNPDAFPDATAIERKWAEVKIEQREFLNSLTEQALRTMFPAAACR